MARVDSESLPSSPDFFFIIGNPRSGTTLLRLMLTCNKSICIPPEGGFVTKFYDTYKDFEGDDSELNKFVDELVHVSKMEYWNLDPLLLKQFLQQITVKSFSSLCMGVYQWYALAYDEPVSVLGDKNNFYLNRIDLLSDIFPNAKFIHIIRDGRDIACSYRKFRKVEGKYAPNLPTSITAIANEWKNNIKKINHSFSKLKEDDVYEIRYEDLVLNTERVLGSLCNFLDVDYDENMLEYHKTNKKEDLEPSDFDKWKKLNKKELTDSRISIWEKGMFDEDIYHFQKIAGSTLNKYDYHKESFTFKEKVKFYFWLP